MADGADMPRPEPGDGSPNESITEWLSKINSLIERLTVDIPADPDERDEEQQARWILANIIDWHRREDKAVWWEYFRWPIFRQRTCWMSGPVYQLSHLPPRLTVRRERQFTATVSRRRKPNSAAAKTFIILAATSWVRSPRFPLTITPSTSRSGRTARRSIRKPCMHTPMSTRRCWQTRGYDSEKYVADNGLRGEGPYQAARDLLLREIPRVGGHPLHRDDETTVQAAVRLCGHLDGGILPIQGRREQAKTFTGAQMICELVRQGKEVGITANSHKVIRNLIDAAIAATDENGMDLRCCHKAREVEEAQPHLSFAKRSEDLLGALGNGVNVGGGTAWLWARPDAFEAIDVLFVDEPRKCHWPMCWRFHKLRKPSC